MYQMNAASSVGHFKPTPSSLPSAFAATSLYKMLSEATHQPNGDIASSFCHADPCPVPLPSALHSSSMTACVRLSWAENKMDYL